MIQNCLRFPFYFLLFVSVVLIPNASGLPVQQTNLMNKALPVWAQGREKEMNLTLGFRGVFKAKPNQKAILRITASSFYRVFLNGKFLGYGPARAAHGYFRVDEYDLGKHLVTADNIVAIEVAGYNVNSFYTIDQPSFLQAELEAEGKIILATGRRAGFESFQIKERLQKVERYSFQRAFTEYYRLTNGSDQWKTSANVPVETLKTAVVTSGKLIPRNLLLPEFTVVHPISGCVRGTIQWIKPAKYYKDRSLRLINDQFKGYPEQELEVVPSQIIQEISDKIQEKTVTPYHSGDIRLKENDFSTVDFGTDLTGFIGAKVTCHEKTKIYFYFDEILTDGDVNTKKRMADVNNLVVYELEPGTYNLESFEPYTLKYLKIIVLQGSCTFEDISLREYASPENPKASFKCNNTKLNDIYNASRQTFRQNAVDLLTDCPSRERAGWLCDSYFSAIMEKDFTGHSAVAHNFYENYALPDSFQFLPKGMIPMCYPADHNDGVYIINWAMWFVIQVNDYARRGGDPVLIARLKPRIEAFLDYCAQYENEDGLLENLKSWVFVEWSEANHFVKGVNYPTNMLYSAVLANADELYRNDSWRKKSERIKRTVIKQSFNGTFFVDNALRNKEGKLTITTNTTEVCQYYAFFFNIASPETHPELWKKLTTEFGPERNDKTTYPRVFRANAFIGNYLRMDILSRYGLKTQLMHEIQDYFYAMAQSTGTLWENMGSQASCNHGFASYIGHALYRDVLGISRIDYLAREITIQFTDSELTECSGVIPIDDSAVELDWNHTGNQINYSVKIPPGYKLKIENPGSLRLVEVKRNGISGS